MRPFIPLALLLGVVGLGGTVHSATYLGTFPPSKQPPTATGPSAYDDGRAAATAAAEQQAPAAREKPPASAEKPAAPPTQAQPDASPAEGAATGSPDKPAPANGQQAGADQTRGNQTGGDQKSGAANFDVKSNFRNICSFCHADYGRKAGRGPQLMDSPRTDEFLFDRIKHGLTGRMPGFGGTYSDAQIHQFVKFIRSLKPGEDPKNPA